MMTKRVIDIRDLPVLAKESTARFASLAALCLSYGGPDGSDWGELLGWIQGRLDAASKHTPDCTIAELEAEEAASVRERGLYPLFPDEFHTVDDAIKAQIAQEAAEEEAASNVTFGGVDLKPGIADGTRVTIASGEGWSAELKGEWETIAFDLKDGTTLTGYARKIPTVKTAGEFEGEY